jgi:hypothetical protein
MARNERFRSTFGFASIGLTITLFLIGAGLKCLVEISGFKPLAQGVWTFIAIATLISIIYLK